MSHLLIPLTAEELAGVDEVALVRGTSREEVGRRAVLAAIADPPKTKPASPRRARRSTTKPAKGKE